MRATEDRFERSILASQHIQKFMILEREKYNKLPAWEKKNREEWLAWEKKEAAKKPSEKNLIAIYQDIRTIIGSSDGISCHP